MKIPYSYCNKRHSNMYMFYGAFIYHKYIAERLGIKFVIF